MKKTNLIKLLSVLLCMVLLFTSCNSKNDPEEDAVTTTKPETTAPQATPREPVDAILENFFQISEADQKTVELKDATRLEGEIVSISVDMLTETEGAFVVFRNAKLDFTNTVTETFTVYNAMLDKTVATFTNTYKYGSAMFDWSNPTIEDDTIPYQETALSVEIENFWIKVRHATLTLIDEEVREENEDGYVYDVKTSYEYYDVTGQLIAKSGVEMYPRSAIFNGGNVFACRFGNATIYFDYETLAMVDRIEGDGTKIAPVYKKENETYGYCFGEQTTAMGEWVEYVEVYNKENAELLFRYYFDHADDFEYYVLENGNVMFQMINRTEDGEAYDFYDGYNTKTLDTYILDVKTQNVKEIACDFLVQYNRLYTKDELANNPGFDDLEVGFTDNVLNLAIVKRINNKKLENAEIVCLDNELGIMFAMASIVPEHKVGVGTSGWLDFGYKVLPNGDYLVDLYNVVTPQAIVKKNGTVRSYLKADDKVAGDYVVNAKGIFDYDGKELYAFDEDTDWTFVRAFEDNIIVSRENKIYAPGADPEKDPHEKIVKEYYTLQKSGSSFASTRVFEDQTITTVADAYLITKNDENGKYTIYNVNMEHVLTTANGVAVYEFEGKYVVTTVLDGVMLYYTLK